MRQAAYIHIPFCRRRCFYCDFPISVIGDRARGETSNGIAEYVNWLCQEIVATPKDALPLKTVFFGGGTPSLLSVQQVEQILQCLDHEIGIEKHAEISMEMDPGTFSKEQLQGLLGLGLNRVSLGVQAFQNHLLERCGRSHRTSDIDDAIVILQQLNIENFSLDLISGLPDQTASDWISSLNQAIAIGPKHLSCYDMVLEPLTVFGKQESKGQLELPEDSLSAQMYRQASETLRAAGYDHYEISNYAQPNYQCRHNLTYWHNDDYYGFGMGAASHHRDRRVSRPRTRAEYYPWVTQLQSNPTQVWAQTPILNESDRRFESIMLGLRLSTGINLATLALSTQHMKQIQAAIAPFTQNGWIETSTDSESTTIKLSDPEGFLYSNQVLVTLWEALDPS